MAHCCERCEEKHKIAIPKPRIFSAARCKLCKKYAVCLDVPEANLIKKK